jgi:hypothetical protein
VVTLKACFTTTYENSDSSLTIVGSMLYVARAIISAATDIFYQNQIAPGFEFGFGLSYTTFEYSNLTIEKLSYSQQFTEDAIWDLGQTPSTDATGASRAIWFHRPTYCIGFYVQKLGR